ncbi:LOW QUALITY PROTEIN: homeobox protein cut [Anthonomus grandis grandis]|uniref:LOW QUALITY PROTEIN: homeobox protein cut n=1 Tax=Anthonomus grandis grandis TaxID=2921223 RepID=UPI0021655951|nr:LOW QUALITY PROTEIN: homeobox protein cut [Anthonomus grandis grandis]
MQPTTAANVPPSGGEMDLQTMQSMEWLFKKERIYLLAQFWQQRATLAEKEVTTLKEQLSGNNGTNNCENKDTSNMDRQSFESEMATKDKEINQLLEEVQRLQGCITKIQESSITQITRLEEQLEQKRQHIVRLESKLDTQKDYDELKRQVTILKSDLVNNPQGKDIELLLEKTKIHHHVQERDKSPSRESEGVTDHQSTLQPPNLPQSPPTTLPHPFQNVDAFGSLLGEEIVSSWRKNIESHQKSPALPSSDGLVKSTTPLLDHTGAEKSSTASTPQPLDSSAGQHSPHTENLVVNGNPKSPHEDNNNHNNHNNNIPLAATFVNNFLRTEDSLKSPYRFEDHRSPFKFAEDLGMAPGSMVGRLGESLIPKGDPMEARLQEMLRYNMDKYASQNLDTLHIARRVRELLSIHNIGQRLFAKYVLGLSQGTVSELLSKPKPWDKLTEKGRDSYRKMHAWACDENAIMLLKSLIPKKDNFSSSGKDGSMPFGRPESDLTDERIAHILSEANQFTHIKTECDTHSNEDSKSPHGCSSPFSKESSLSKRLKKYENDDIPRKKVVRIYQEELAKLMGRRMEDIRNPREGGFPQGNMPLDRSEEIRMAFDAYHRELAKLNQTQPSAQMPLGLLALQQQALAQHNQQSQSAPQPLTQSNGGVQDLSLPKDKMKIVNGMDEVSKDKDGDDSMSRHSGSAFSLVRPKIEPGTGAGGNSTASSPIGNTILPPMTPTSEDFTASAAASPLQRMASITNSLISQPPAQPHHTSTQRPLKAVLPPITQQQFDLYNNLNTEDIVKKVKEQLSQYSISQRLFGESVLGLSQGSVSDLLARPKPWHMLTQKGREPFIRMKMFLEDNDAVHKLVASQYKIAPEKLMRTGGYGNACAASLSKPTLPTNPKMLSEAAGLLTKMQHDSQSLLPSSLQLGPPQGGQPQPSPLGPPTTTQMPQTQLLNHLALPPHHAIALQNQELLKKQQQSMQGGHGIPNHSPMGHQGMRGMHQHMSPSVYEMAALTQDLDTQVITTKIKEALLAHNIGQKIFGEAVLGLSQGSVSELLSKPKPWHMLSIKGREPFIRMQLWLQDTHNVDRLQALKNERREANKRRRSSGPGHDNSSDTSSNDTSEFYHSNSPGPQGPPNAKKQRVLFSEEQKEALRLAFALDPYPNVATIEFLAQELSLSSRTITNWFHNHRMRLKQQVPHGMPSDIPPRDQNSSQQPFDPVQFRVLLNQRLMELSKERMGLSGVHLPYPPYLAANPGLAALISRGLLPTADLGDLSALNNAVKEQMSGLDLSMTSLKREPNEFEDEDDVESNVGSEDSNISGSLQDDGKNESGKEANISSASQNQGRSSRRKPAAPMWVNPHWEEEKNTQTQEKSQSNQDEVIINGVCVMQTEDNYNPRRSSTEETIRVEPQAVLDRYEDDRSDTSSVSHEASNVHDEPSQPEEVGTAQTETTEEDRDENSERKEVKTENEDERWDY